MSGDGRLFGTDMHSLDDNRQGRILLFENWNEPAKRFDSVHTFLAGLHNPNELAFYKGFMYVAETGRLRRFKYEPASRQPADTGETIAIFPNYGLSYKYGGWHLTRSISFHNEKLYVSVGSSCNACIEKEAVRASIIEMNPDGSEARIYARGLRNSVGVKWIGGKLWVTSMGRDLIGPDKPEDLFQQVKEDGYYGWPFYFQYSGNIYEDELFKDSLKPSYATPPAPALLGFKAHSAPLGFEYMKSFADAALANSVLVCLHGSTSIWRQRGYAIVQLQKGKYVDVISGFLTGKTAADRHGRPCDILMKNETAFFFTDDLKGVLYYVYR